MADDMILGLRNITKTYPGVVALHDVSLEIRRGEVHALVGENGAGKSTLIKTCSGAVMPDSGIITVNGKEFKSMSPRLSLENGIAVIYQEFNLVDELSVAENIFLGKAPRKNGICINRAAMEAKAAEIFKSFDIKIDPKEKIRNLTVGYQQLVEIAKAVSENARLLIMDEPSAPLTSAETGKLFEMVDKLKASGVTIIYISHRLDEIFRLSDRITIMRDGRKIETLATDDTTTEYLITVMVGRELTRTYPIRNIPPKDEVLLEVKHLYGNGLKDISFTLHQGEVLGFAGLIGAGRTELSELLFGVAGKTSGDILFKGMPINPKTPEEAIAAGIALVPEDRKRQGALLDIDIKGNISLSILRRISSLMVVHRKEEMRIAENYKNSLRIKTPNLLQKIKNLSGGNQQKVIIARWLAVGPDLIILDEPTRGIDVGAKHEIYTLINELVESGKTIMMISSEMEELMGMSDRIIVLAEGGMTGEITRKDFNQESIMDYASRTKREEPLWITASKTA
jgi:ribose transport system ATP-binding protein